MKYAICFALALIVNFTPVTGWSQDAEDTATSDTTESAAPEVPDEVDTRTLVAGPTGVSAEELTAVNERVTAAITPMTLEELAAPAPGMGISIGIGGVTTPVRSWGRDDGVKVTVMSAQKGSDQPPTNVGVWHSTEAGGGGLASLFGGNAGKLVLRLHEPTTEPAAQPFGFQRVRLFNAGIEEEYSLESGAWVMRRYEGAEE